MLRYSRREFRAKEGGEAWRAEAMLGILPKAV
jgi:hypothetical protein